MASFTIVGYRCQVLGRRTFPGPCSTFNVSNYLGLTYLSKLRVGLSHFHKQKFRHNFRDSLNPICHRRNTTEFTKRYLFHCSDTWSLLQNIGTINSNLLYMNEDVLTHLLLFDDNTLTDSTDTFLLNWAIEYITSPKRFHDPLTL